MHTERISYADVSVHPLTGLSYVILRDFDLQAPMKTKINNCDSP